MEKIGKYEKTKSFKSYVFWITGLPGSGKTTLGKKVLRYVKKNIGPSILINGDDIRKIFKSYKYSKKERIKIVTSYSNLAKLINDHNINVIFTTNGLFYKIYKLNKKNFKNYIEIFIKTKFEDTVKYSGKKIFNDKHVYGKSIKPEFPKKPHIVIQNNFKKSLRILEKELITKIKNTINR